MVFCSVCFALPACFFELFSVYFFCLGLPETFLLYGFVVFCGAYFIQLNYFVTAHNKAIEKSPQLSITFDDGPHKIRFKICHLSLFGKDKIIHRLGLLFIISNIIFCKKRFDHIYMNALS